MLAIFSFAVMAMVAYAFLQEGMLTAFTTLVNVMLAGLVAFNYFEPLAINLETAFRDSFLEGYEDCLALVGIFSIVLAILKLVTNHIADEDLELNSRVNQAGAVVFGLITGYLLAGILVCAFQTLPFTRKFAGFDYKADPSDPQYSVRRVLPPDRVWLAMMHRAGRGPFSTKEGPTFDADGSFPMRYTRHRRDYD